jgi:NAD(P)H-flavin reductase
VSTIGPGSGQQHLIALLRTIRAQLLAEAAQAADATGTSGRATGARGAAGRGPAGTGGDQVAARPGPPTAGPGSSAAGSPVPVGQPVPVLGRPTTPGTPIQPLPAAPPTPPGAPAPGVPAQPATPPPATPPPGPGAPPTLAGPHPARPAAPAPTGTAPVGTAPVGSGAHGGGHPVVGGDHPDGDAVLRDLQRVLRRCLAEAGPTGEVAGRLRDILAVAQPQLLVALPGPPESQREELRAALVWLVETLDRPQAVAAGCGQLGGVLREWGVAPQQAQLVGAALAEALRAGMGAAWTREYDTAWRTTWRLVHRWLADGAAADWTPVAWSGVVVEHDRRRADLAVLRIRPYLPYRFLPGQYTRLEVPQHPQVWRPYSLAGAPRFDNVLELHVRAKGAASVSGALVYDTKAGDRVRVRAAGGEMVLDPASRRDLLMIAGDTGVAPFKALLTELAVTADPRTAVLFWGVRTLDDLYDVADLEAIARSCRRATVVPVVSDGDPGPYPSGLVTDAVAAYGEWSGADVFLAGPPAMVAATTVILRTLLRIDPARIRHDPASL